MAVSRLPWRPIEPLSREDRSANGSLAALDALRKEWANRLAEVSESVRSQIRRRTLRKLAIETGILERLYEVEWGLTLTLVAEGFTRDVIERANGVIDERTLATLKAHLDSLELVYDFVKQSRSLSAGFIKELHQSITRTQDTYVATDPLGRVVDADLLKGQWKIVPNHVERQDGTLLEYAPPEQVQSEIERLIGFWKDLENDATVHPVIKATWLHHRFVQIHPFQDGNGRVARALALLVLESEKFAPLVIDRWHRDEYLKSLDAANDGSLRDLVRLFVKLEGSALTSELERPEEEPVSGLSIDIAHTLADQLAFRKKQQQTQIVNKLKTLGVAVSGRTQDWFRKKRDELDETFRKRGVGEVEVFEDTQRPPSEKLHWFRGQIIDSARHAGYYADFRNFHAWSQLRVKLPGWTLRFVASVHGAGRDVGVMSVTTFAEIELQHDDTLSGHEPPTNRRELIVTGDAFRLVHTETVDDLNKRGPEIEELLDTGLAEGLLKLLKKV